MGPALRNRVLPYLVLAGRLLQSHCHDRAFLGALVSTEDEFERAKVVGAGRLGGLGSQ